MNGLAKLQRNMMQGEDRLTNPAQNVPLLVIEDEPEMAGIIRDGLSGLGYSVCLAQTTEEGLTAARTGPASLLIVDRMLNGTDSLTMIEALRAEGIRIPVLVVSALASVDDRIRGLKAGGDDYLTKPFDMGELAARVEALLRRSNDTRGTRVLDLLPTEFKLLEYLMRRPGQVVTRAMLLEDVWHYRFLPQTNLVDVHIGKLRRKVDGPGEPPLIRSVRRSGFMLHVGD